MTPLLTNDELREKVCAYFGADDSARSLIATDRRFDKGLLGTMHLRATQPEAHNLGVLVAEDGNLVFQHNPVGTVDDRGFPDKVTYWFILRPDAVSFELYGRDADDKPALPQRPPAEDILGYTPIFPPIDP